MKPYPVMEEKAEMVRMNPPNAPAPSAAADKRPVPPPRKAVKPRVAKDTQLSLIGLLKGLVYVDEYHRAVSYRPKKAVLVCATPGKKLVFAHEARRSALSHAVVSPVVLSNFQEFHGFPVRRILESVTTRKYDGTKCLGQLTDIVYWSDKCIDPESCRSAADYHHRFGPEFPRLFVNPGELLLLEGGSYTITRRGIIG